MKQAQEVLSHQLVLGAGWSLIRALNHLWTAASSHRGRTPLSVIRNSNSCIAAQMRTQNCYSYTLRLCSKMPRWKKKKQKTTTVSGCQISSLPLDTQLFGHMGFFISLPSHFASPPPSQLSLLLHQARFVRTFGRVKSEGINQIHNAVTAPIIRLRLIPRVS